ncbi:putative nitrate reductase [Diaporthe ampelina]|uniref:Nitrate reductase n=1 Tax=Diaporthe ampelina TaxID=1214573 RepID=A0A0G2FHL9_9PEZI|nr:putative nitrate reductase [Diaporthe ampelina]
MPEPRQNNLTQKLGLPPSPPATDKDPGSRTESLTDFQIGESTIIPGYRPYPLPPEPRANQRVLPEDLRTPDKHVPRDPRLLRLTGVHPFNVEAPLTELWDEGFITTKDLHYVRNHGAVPLVHDEDILDWGFTVEGLVENPLTLTLRDLLADFEQVTYPVTLVCAGNRRKEQNVVRKTKGFSWGPAGLSTALWTGVPLDVLLARARPILRGNKRARYVCFEGADKLPNGYYGTSIKLNWATDPSRGVLVAHGMNGEVLPPDHGKPLRIVIPGQIGGRSVKWLRRIVVTEAPSDNWYHIYDNRVLPTTISPEESADLPDTWKDERYAIYDLNANSAVARPAHGERVAVDDAAGDPAKTFKFQGYAYAGGGRRVTRVELTLDRGRSWRLADVSYPEDEYRLAPEGEMLFGGRLDVGWRESCFCWCFWSLEIPLADLAGDGASGSTGDVMVRAMDDAMMVQPRDMYWSVLGMMNNPWFRVVVHRDEAGGLRFEHPTQPVLNADGWMDRVKKEGGDLSNGYWGEKAPGEEKRTVAAVVPVKEIVMVNRDVKRMISLEELKGHEGEEEPWFVLDGEVYDGTKFLGGHPGGAASIIGAAGQDVVEEFMAIHSENAKAMMPSYHIGTLDAASKKTLAAGDSAAAAEATPSEPRAVFLQPKAWTKARLTSKTPVSSDTKVFTFALEHESQRLGLPTGQHLMMRLRDPATREAIIRAYTPLTDDGAPERGKLDVLVKIYRAAGGLPGGLMTQALDSIPLGHWVEFKGPVGRFEYLGRGRFAVGGGQVRRIRRFVMVCAGSGVTPVFAVLRAVMGDDADTTRCLVLDGNRSEADILCRAEMDALAAAAAKHGDRCRIVHTLSAPGDGWTGRRGTMDAKLFEDEAGPPSEARDEMVLVCGPPGLVKAVREIFTRMGWREEDFAFF